MPVAARQEHVFTHLKCYRGGKVLSKENVTEGAMSTEESMSIDERRKYLKKMQKTVSKSKPPGKRSVAG